MLSGTPVLVCREGHLFCPTRHHAEQMLGMHIVAQTPSYENARDAPSPMLPIPHFVHHPQFSKYARYPPTSGLYLWMSCSAACVATQLARSSRHTNAECLMHSQTEYRPGFKHAFSWKGMRYRSLADEQKRENCGLLSLAPQTLVGNPGAAKLQQGEEA